MAGSHRQKNNIVLIGFMGTGKTTVGRLLAQRTGRTFVDLDEEIERSAGLPVSAIFAQYGEAFFRDQERQIIRQLSDRSDLIIATGGGAVLCEENVSNLRQCGLVIALQCQPDIIAKRIAGDPDVRPLVKQKDSLQIITGLLQERRSRYEAANFTIDTSWITVSEVVSKLENLITIWQDSVLLTEPI